MKFNWFKNDKGVLKTKLKIKISTPKGQAAKIYRRFGHLFKIFILATTKPKEEVADDSTIIWTVETTPKESLNINKRLGQFDNLVKGIFQKKFVQKAIRKKFSVEQQKEVEEMLINHTKIEIME